MSPEDFFRTDTYIDQSEPDRLIADLGSAVKTGANKWGNCRFEGDFLVNWRIAA
jgi:hypothetical protein